MGELRTLARKLIDDHLVDGEPAAGREIGLRVGQTLTQDATGTLVMQELEALDLDRAKTDVSVQYVDHNLLQADEKNAEDHTFLRSACRRYGVRLTGSPPSSTTVPASPGSPRWTGT
jgi:aconitate hydratase